jgi:2'-5' RNA ligase
MSSRDDGLEPCNCFALVTYVPEPLGAFLDQMRRELVPNCATRAHVTILPPRPLLAPASVAIEELTARVAEFPSFQIEARAVEIFENTSVIYIGIGAGHAELLRIHAALNAGPLEFQEPFAYHPHITVAQDLDCGQVPGLSEEAARRWAEFKGERSFRAESLAFVQNTVQNRWVDLAHWNLAAAPGKR